MVAEELVVLELGVVERALAENDPGVGTGRHSATQRLDHRLAHVVRVVVALEPLEGAPVATVRRVAEHYHVARARRLTCFKWITVNSDSR